jgi:integrase
MLSEDSVVQKFLDHLKTPGTRALHTYGLAEFQRFYQPQGTIPDFLDRIEADLKQTGWRTKSMVDTETLGEFAEYLKAKGLSANSIRSYVSAVQRICKYYRMPVSLLDVKLPAPIVASKKHPWNLEQIGRLIELFDDPMHKALAALLYQSGLSLVDCLSLEYQDISEEYEQGISPICLDLARHKTGVEFITFAGSWSVSLLRIYLNEKHLKPKERLFQTTKESVDAYFRVRGKQFLGAYSTARNPCRPHSLHGAFKTLSNRANVVENFIVEYFMGHNVHDMDKTYTSMDREGWRETYRLIEPFLDPRTLVPKDKPETALATVQ